MYYIFLTFKRIYCLPHGIGDTGHCDLGKWKFKYCVIGSFLCMGSLLVNILLIWLKGIKMRDMERETLGHYLHLNPQLEESTEFDELGLLTTDDEEIDVDAL